MSAAAWHTRNGPGPIERDFPNPEAARQAVMDYLTERGVIGTQHMGMRFHWEGDWRFLLEVPDGFVQGWELYERGVTTGQRILERRCECHEWHDVEAIGDWVQGSGGGRAHARPVREIVATDPIWEHSETTHAALLEGIKAAGGIACDDAPAATAYLDGVIGLNNGIHRWAVCDELGVKRVPVEMRHEREEQPQDPAWSLDWGVAR